MEEKEVLYLIEELKNNPQVLKQFNNGLFEEMASVISELKQTPMLLICAGPDYINPNSTLPENVVIVPYGRAFENNEMIAIFLNAINSLKQGKINKMTIQ